jgi:ubiquitin
VCEQLEIGGKKKLLEEDDMVCKLCVPDEAISEEETPTQQSASEESGSEESCSEESAYDDETSILTKSVIVEKSAPTIASPKEGTKLKCSYSKCESRLFLSED